MSIAERIERLGGLRKADVSDPKLEHNKKVSQYARFLSELPEALRTQQYLFDELRATGIIQSIGKIAYSIYLEPKKMPYYEELARRELGEEIARRDFSPQELEELEGQSKDWFAQTGGIDMSDDGTPKTGLEIDLHRVRESQFVFIKYRPSRLLTIKGSSTTFSGAINVHNIDQRLSDKIEDSLAKALVNPYPPIRKSK